MPRSDRCKRLLPVLLLLACLPPGARAEVDTAATPEGMTEATAPPATEEATAASAEPPGTRDGTPPSGGERDLEDLAIEELVQLKVTTAGRKAQRLAEVPGAIYVLTGEEIRRSGATSIPEALRQVPGVHVARIDGNKWAISIRGFNYRYANKLLVLMDGRTVYSPLFAGVYWDTQDTLLEDIERIEVIRGPGGTLWGANAMNGIINLITRSARDTEGSLSVLGTGDEEKGFTGLRHGGSLGRNGSYRLYGKAFSRDGFVGATRVGGPDDWDALRGGFRLDWGAPNRETFMLDGGAYGGRSGIRQREAMLDAPYSRTFDADSDSSGYHLLGRWSRAGASGSDRSLQLFLDQRSMSVGDYHETMRTLDLDYQHRFTRARHELIWGLGYRLSTDRTTGGFAVSFAPPARSHSLGSAFVQDEYRPHDRLSLTLGTKLEYTRDVGVQLQPGFRVLWRPDDRHSYWGAVSRAVRTPSRAEQALRVPLAVQPGEGGPPVVIRLDGDPEVGEESVLAWELGSRFQRGDHVSLDVTAFYNDYKNLMSLDRGTPFMSGTAERPYLVVPILFTNARKARTLGLEVAARCRISDRWRLVAGWSLFDLRLLNLPPAARAAGPTSEDTSPRHQFHLGSYFDLPGNLELDTQVYSVGRLRYGNIPGYVSADLRLGWRPHERYEISVGVHNLFNHAHKEFVSSSGEATGTFGRRVYGKVTWTR